MSEVEFLPLWYVRKRRRSARLKLIALLATLPIATLAAWLWLA